MTSARAEAAVPERTMRMAMNVRMGWLLHSPGDAGGGKPGGRFPDLGENLLGVVVARVGDHPVDPDRDLLHLRRPHATAGDRRRPQADARRIEGLARVVG